MSATSDKYYVVKLWLLSIVISTLLFVTSTIIISKTIEADILLFIIFMFLYSIAYSLPTFVIISLIYKFGIKRLNLSNKFFLSLISVVFMLITIFILFGKKRYNIHNIYSGLTFSTITIISISIATLILNIKNRLINF